MSQLLSIQPKSTEVKLAQAKLLEALVDGDEPQAFDIVVSAMDQRWEPAAIYVRLVGRSLAEIGALWHSGELSIAVEHRATQIALRLLSRAQATYLSERRTGLRALVTGVQGEQHMVGGLTFADFLRFEGWQVDFLGADTPAESIAGQVSESRVDLVGLSVTGPSNLRGAARTIDLLKRLPDAPAIIVGGKAVEHASAVDLLRQSDHTTSNMEDAMDWTRTHFDLGASTKTLDVMLVDLGSHIQGLRKSRGMSQQQLAQAAGLDRSYVSGVEHGKQNVSFATMKNIADALGVTVSDLMEE
jgi:methanogenic corrinoid protein MtbC1/DNA-binding XRE family transcriptional regulator